MHQLGYWAGQIVRNGVPYFSNIPGTTTDGLKALSASLAASGGVTLYHVENTTPEAEKYSMKGVEVVDFGNDELIPAASVSQQATC